MTTVKGALAPFRQGALAPQFTAHQLPENVYLSAVLPANASQNYIQVEQPTWSRVAVIIDLRATSPAPRIVTLLAKFTAIFTIGFSSALLYSAAPADRAVLRIILPSPVRAVPLPRSHAWSRFAGQAKRSTQPMAPTFSLPPVSQSKAVVDHEKPTVQNSAPHVFAIAELAEVRAAGDLAISTGTAQPWRESGLHGYVVAGPIQFLGANSCRIVAVWVEAKGTPGKSIASRRCLAKSGKWETTTAFDRLGALEPADAETIEN